MKMFKKEFTLSKSKGFTLIELLVVIAIIGILATVVIINVSGARVKATKNKIAADLSTGIRIYNACQSFGGTPIAIPTTGGSSSGICNTDDMADATEISASTGMWPSLVDGYQYVTIAQGHGGIIEVQSTPPNIGTANLKYVMCAISGCSTGTDW